MKKITVNQVLVWVAQAAVVGFMIPTIIGFLISTNRLLTLEGSFFLIPIIMGLIGYSILGEVATTVVMGITAIVFVAMLIALIFFKRAPKFGIFLLSVFLLDLTTMFAWFKGEVFSVSYVTTNLIIHLVIMGLIIVAMVVSYRSRVLKQEKASEKQELADAEVEFEVENKLVDPQSEPEDESTLVDPQPEPEENTVETVSSDS